MGILLAFMGFPAHGYELTIKNDRMLLDASNVQLQTILKDITRQTGIFVRIDPELNPKISAGFKNKDIQSGLKIILKSLDHVLKWERETGSVSSRVRLSSIEVFQQGKQDRTQQLKSNVSLDIARNPEDGSLFVKGELLVRLKPGMTQIETARFIKTLNGILIEKNQALGIYRIKVSNALDIPKFVKQLEQIQEIQTVEPNYAYPIQQPFRYTSDLNIPACPDYSGMGDGSFPIAILDSGLAPGNLPKSHILAATDALNSEDPISDPLGHGTQMALIASGIVTPFGAAKNNLQTSPIIAVRTFDENGYTSSAALMNGIQFALDNGARILSLSWGSSTKSRFIEKSLEYGTSKGLIIVASAGNEAIGKPIYPAAYDTVIGIGALAPDGKKWDTSNYGDFVEGYAPGFADMPVGYKGDPGIYAGTSISAALAAKKIADFLSKNPDASRREIIKNL